MDFRLCAAILACCLAVRFASGQATQPVVEGRLDYRASRAFDVGITPPHFHCCKNWRENSGGSPPS